MRYGKWLSIVALFALSALVLPAEADAQGRFSVDAQGGIAVPVSDLKDLTDVGPSFGGGITYWITPRFAIRGDFDANLLDGKDDGPDINLLHYNGGLQFEIIDPRTSPWSFTVNVAGGGTTLNADDFQTDEGLVDFTETYFALNGGLGIGYNLSRNFSIFVDGQWYLTFTDDDETSIFSQISPDVDPDGFDTASVIPITIGFRLKTN